MSSSQSNITGLADSSLKPSYDGINNAKGLRLLEGTTGILVTVGGTDKIRSWVLPKNLIIHHSPFFAAALNGSFLESSLNSIKLIEDDPAIFELFVQWLFLGKIDNDPEELDYCETCLMAWVLGDKLGCLKFKDYFMICIIEYHEGRYLDASSIRYAYTNAPSTSKLRQWALMQFWYESSLGNLQDEEDDEDFFKIWNTLVAETEGLAHDLTLLLIRSHKPKAPYLNKQPYLSEPASQS